MEGVGCGVFVASGAIAAYAEQHPNVGWSVRSLSWPVLALALRNGSVTELGSPACQYASDRGLCSHAVDEPSAHDHPLLRVAREPALCAPTQYH